jgi:Domain of Unknown Function with PDB structure (DUF3857)/Transglutaminase-like superfamily
MGFALSIPKHLFAAFLRCPGLVLLIAMSCLWGLPFASAQEKPKPAPALQPAPNPPAPLENAPTAPTLATKGPDVSKEALAFDKLYTRVHEEADGTGTRETTARLRILADAGVKAMAVLAFTYTASNQQIDVAYVRVIKPDGSVVITPGYNIQDLPADVTREAPMYSDIHQKHVAVKGLGVGDTLEYQLTLRTFKPDVPGQFWLEFTFEKNLIVLDEQLDLDVPADKPVKVAATDLQPTVTVSAGRKLYHWASSNLARPDPDAPPKSTKHWKPSVQVTTFTSWQQVGEWYASLQKDPLTVTPAIEARAASLTKGIASDEDKVRALFSDVALHIHYVGLDFGIGRYQPHPADDVLSNEYGDCKDKHTLLAAMLKSVGIQAWPVLISSSRSLDPDTPSPAQFDHVITLVSLSGKLLWLDSTAEVAPVGVLFGNLRDKQALAIPPDKPAYLERTAADLPFFQTTNFQVEGKLSNEGVFTGHFVQSFHGDGELIMRAAFRSVPQSQWKDFLQGVSNATGFGGEVSNPDVSAIEQTAQPVRYSYDYTREKYGEWDNRRISPPMPPVGWELAPGVKQKKPADDVEIGSPGELVYLSSVQLPSGWLLFPPAGTDVKEDWAEYHSTYAFADGKFTAERHLTVKRDKVPLDQWEKYLAFRRAVFDDEVRMMPLQNPAGPLRSSDPGFTDSPNLALAHELLNALGPLHDLPTILETNPPPGPEVLTKEVNLSSEALETIETKSLALAPSDPASLFSAAPLAYAWCLRGWVALAKQDLPTAEKYLQVSWHLSHDRIAGYLLARTLAAKNNKAEAAHLYELAHVTTASRPLGGFFGDSFDVDEHIAADYLKLTGKKLAATSLNHGAYEGSLDKELDDDLEIRQFIHSTKLTGSGLYSVAFEAGKPVKANFLQGDKGFTALAPALQAHTFPAQLPGGSKARLLREVNIICSPWAGCDAYLLASGSIKIPVKNNIVNVAPPPNSPPGTKVVQIQIQP